MIIETVTRLIDEGDYPGALEVLDPYMEENPDDAAGLFLFGQVMLASEKPAIAYLAYKRVSELMPGKTETWVNLGKAAGELHLFDEEERYAKKALKIDPDNHMAMLNLSANGYHRRNPDQIIHWAKKALKYCESADAHHNLGFGLLMKWQFELGWKEYEYGLGTVPSRTERNYIGEPRWDGRRGTVVIYGEQGLGDQIAFAAPIEEAKTDATVILDIHHKLKGLFQRSFGVETHGDYRNKEIQWPFERQIDANCALSSLQRFYRNGADQFSGKPFLIPDPNRVTQWRALLATLGDKPKIGLAWNGGTVKTESGERSTTLEALLPLLQEDVTWVSLEYKDCSAEITSFEQKHGIKIHDFPWGTQTEDYDDTAALVSELDLVISVPTSVIHLAGGLGVECWCVVPKSPSFMFGIEGRAMPYYQSVELFRRDKGWGIVEELRGRLHEFGLCHTDRVRPRRDLPDSSGVYPDSHAGQGAIY